MVSFSGIQKSIIIDSIELITVKISDIRNRLFSSSTNINEMYFWDVVNSLTYTKNPPADLKPFKPANRQLIKDSEYWESVINNELKFEINKSIIDIQPNTYQNLLFKLSRLNGWLEMITRAYISEDIPCYHNLLKFPTRLGGFTIGEEVIIMEPTPDIGNNSQLCKIQTLLQGKRQVYFDVSPYIDIVEEIKLENINIINELNNPTPTGDADVTPVYIDALGTRQLIETILDSQNSTKIGIDSIIRLVTIGNEFIDFTLRFLRENTKQDLLTCQIYLEYLMGGNPQDVGVTSTNEIKYIWLIGSEGNYYPVPPVESTDLENDIYISMNNGILAGLKRADENARWRYRRINDALYEVATNNNINKSYLESLSSKIDILEEKINGIQTKIDSIETKIDSILQKIQTL